MRVLACSFGILLASVVAAAPATQEPATIYSFVNPSTSGPPCGSQVVDFSQQGNHIRLELQNHALVVSDDPRLTGPGTVEVVVNRNAVSGRGVAQGSLVLEPAGFAGTWEADFNLHIPGSTSFDVDGLTVLKDGQINARGTGVFERQWFLFKHTMAAGDGPFEAPVPDPDGPGGCEFLGEIGTGRLLTPQP